MRESRARRAITVGCIAITAGCGSPVLSVSVEEMPEQVDYLALLPIVRGRAESGSGLVPAGGPGQSSFELSAEADDYALVGYARSQVGEISDEVLRASPLREATAAEPILPPPVWARGLRFEGERGVLGEAPSLGPLTARWAQCAFDPERHYVHVRCVSCSPFVELRRRECALTIDTGGCFLGIDTIDIPLASSGGFGPPSVPGQTCEVVPNAAPSVLAFECTIPQAPHQCRFDLIERVPPSEIPFVVDRRGLVSRPRAESNFEVRLEVYGRGYVPDLVVLGDRVIVSVHDREPSSWYCADPTPGALLVLDADTLQTIVTATAPPCLYAMAPSSRPGEFVGAFGETVPSVGRFDATGRLLTQRSLADVLPFSRARAIDVELRPDGEVVVLVNETRMDQSEFDLGAMWLEIDPHGLEVTASHLLAGNHALLRVDPDNRSSASRLASETITTITPDGPRSSESYRFLCDAAALRMGDHVPLGGDRHLLIGRQLYPFVFGVDFGASVCQRDAVAEIEADPASIIRGMGDDYLVTARGRDPDRTALLLRLDARGLLLRPGALPIGSGLTRLRRIDERGRVFGVAPESGHVFRVDPL